MKLLNICDTYFYLFQTTILTMSSRRLFNDASPEIIDLSDDESAASNNKENRFVVGRPSIDSGNGSAKTRCNYCLKIISKGSMASHIKSVHRTITENVPMNQDISCKVCGAEFENKRQLHLHIQTKHSAGRAASNHVTTFSKVTTNVTTKEPKRILSRPDPTKHVPSGMAICPHCEMSVDEKELVNHIKSAHRGPSGASNAAKAPANFVRIKCKMCKETFRSESAFDKHPCPMLESQQNQVVETIDIDESNDTTNTDSSANSILPDDPLSGDGIDLDLTVDEGESNTASNGGVRLRLNSQLAVDPNPGGSNILHDAAASQQKPTRKNMSIRPNILNNQKSILPLLPKLPLPASITLTSNNPNIQIENELDKHKKNCTKLNCQICYPDLPLLNTDPEKIVKCSLCSVWMAQKLIRAHSIKVHGGVRNGSRVQAPATRGPPPMIFTREEVNTYTRRNSANTRTTRSSTRTTPQVQAFYNVQNSQQDDPRVVNYMRKDGLSRNQALNIVRQTENVRESRQTTRLVQAQPVQNFRQPIVAQPIARQQSAKEIREQKKMEQKLKDAEKRHKETVKRLEDEITKLKKENYKLKRKVKELEQGEEGQESEPKRPRLSIETSTPISAKNIKRERVSDASLSDASGASSIMFDASSPKPKSNKFTCEFCDQIYKSDTQLKEHLNSMHSLRSAKTRKINCDFCDQTFSSISTLKSHINDKHDNTYTCDSCKISFDSLSKRRNHPCSKDPLKIKKELIENEMPKAKRIKMENVLNEESDQDRYARIHKESIEIVNEPIDKIIDDVFAKDRIREENEKMSMELIGNIINDIFENERQKQQTKKDVESILDNVLKRVIEKSAEKKKKKDDFIDLCSDSEEGSVIFSDIVIEDQNLAPITDVANIEDFTDEMTKEATVTLTYPAPVNSVPSVNESKIIVRGVLEGLLVTIAKKEKKTTASNVKPTRIAIQAVDSSVKKLACDFCNKIFVDSNSLEMHKKKENHGISQRKASRKEKDVIDLCSDSEDDENADQATLEKKEAKRIMEGILDGILNATLLEIRKKETGIDHIPLVVYKGQKQILNCFKCKKTFKSLMELDRPTCTGPADANDDIIDISSDSEDEDLVRVDDELEYITNVPKNDAALDVAEFIVNALVQDALDNTKDHQKYLNAKLIDGIIDHVLDDIFPIVIGPDDDDYDGIDANEDISIVEDSTEFDPLGLDSDVSENNSKNSNAELKSKESAIIISDDGIYGL